MYTWVQEKWIKGLDIEKKNLSMFVFDLGKGKNECKGETLYYDLALSTLISFIHIHANMK